MTATSTDGGLGGTCITTVTVLDNVILTNNGTIEIGGILSGSLAGAPYVGQTTSKYTKILLKDNAQILSTGTIKSFGYIMESSLNNESKVTIQKGSLYAPFIVRDFKGGSISYGLYNSFDSKHSTPFNQFEVRNVQSILEIDYNGQLIGMANIYAGDQQNPTSASLIGNSSSSVIQFTNSTYSKVICKYDDNTDIIDIDIYGGAKTNAMELILKVFGDIKISTSKVYFPLSWQYDVSLNQGDGQTDIASYEINQRFKVMTGAKLTVSAGAKLTASDLIVYSSFNDSTANLNGVHYPIKEAGTLIVNGEMKATNLAGVVYSTSSGAQLTVTGSSTITSYEPKTFTGLSIFTKIDSWLEVNETLKLILYNKGDTLFESPVGYYMSKDGAWYTDECYIYYNRNGGTLTGNTFEGEYTTGLSGYLINKINTTDPIRDHYTFGGWYIDSSCTIEAVGQRIYTNSYVYAKWIPIKNYIKYEITNETGETFEYKLDNTKVTIESIFDLTIPTNGSYVFDGWYIDSAKTTKISQFVASDYEDKFILGAEAITLYGTWYPAGTSTYSLSFVTNNSNFAYEDQVVVSSRPTMYTLPNPGAVTDNDYDNPIYFIGWYLDEALNTPFVEGQEITSNITLYAKWGNKITIKYKYQYNSLDIELLRYYVPGLVTFIESVSDVNTGGESFVWFLDKECNSSNFYTGGKLYTIEENLTVYGDLYYVIDNTMYVNKSFNIGDHTQVLFYKVAFNETLKTAISWNMSDLNRQPSSNNTYSKFKGSNFEKLLLEGCSGINKTSSGTTYLLDSQKHSTLVLSKTYYGLTYNGLFAECDNLTTVIAKDTTLENHMFANCDNLTIVIDDNTVTTITADSSVALRPIDVLENWNTDSPTIVGI